MSMADLFTTIRGYETEFEALAAQKDSLTQQVADLQNQVDTANLQHTNDQTTISQLNTQVVTLQASLADARAQLANVNALLATDADMIEKQAKDIHMAQMQLAQLNSVKVYDGLEYRQFAENSKSEVGGSGNGTHKMTPASAAGMAKIRIVPGPRTDPTKPNYFDDYCTLDFPLDDAIMRWKMETTFIFATQADADAVNCLELEARQVLKDGSMYVAGQQLNFGSNTFRYWDHAKHWTPSGAPCPKFTAGNLYHASVEGHRDATTIYHDAISLNDLRIPLTASYPSWKESPIWRQMLRCAIQLDAKDTAFEVVIGNTKFTVSQ